MSPKLNGAAAPLAYAYDSQHGLKYEGTSRKQYARFYLGNEVVDKLQRMHILNRGYPDKLLSARELCAIQKDNSFWRFKWLSRYNKDC